MTVISLITILSVLNATVLVTPRILYAIGRDGLFTERATRVSRSGTPRVALAVLYAQRRSVPMDLRILMWTGVAVLARRDVAVHRSTTQLGLRRRPKAHAAVVRTEAKA